MTTSDPAILNARAARSALLLAGLAAQFAVMPVLSVTSDVVAALALLIVGLTTVRLPLPKVAPGARPGALRLTMGARQAGALAIIMAGAVLVLARVNGFDANSKAAALATLLLVVQVAHCLALQTRREAALGCGIVLVMLSVGATFAGDVTLLLPLMVALPCVAVTAALLHRGTLIDSADAASTDGAGAIVRACVTPVVLATVIGLVVFLALPNSGHLRTDTHFSTGAAGRSTTAASGLGGVTRGASNPGSGMLDLRARGGLSNDPVLEVTADSPQYWEGAIFSHFDGRRWIAGGPFTRWGQSSEQGQVAPAENLSNSETSSSYVVTVLTRTALDAVVGPGRPAVYAGTGTVASDGEGTAHLFHGPAAGANETYRVVSMSPSVVSDAVLRAGSGDDTVDPRWLELPSDLPARVNSLAGSLAAGASSRFDAVNAIEDYLRSNEKYNLDSPLPAIGEDAVDDFVFVSHQGFCEQFATAAVIMLRTQGIPARLVTGYINGDSNATPGKRIYRGRDAHAWVQVFYPGVGWVNSDPTASASLAAAKPSVRQQVGDMLKKAWHKVPGGRWGAIGLLVLAVAVAVGAGIVGRRWLRRRRRDAGIDRGRSNDGPVLAAYLRLDAVLHDVERSRAPTESFREIARRLGGLVASAAEVTAAVGYLERESYAVDPPSPEESAFAVEVFDRLREAAGSQPVALAAAPGPAGHAG